MRLALVLFPLVIVALALMQPATGGVDKASGYYQPTSPDSAYSRGIGRAIFFFQCRYEHADGTTTDYVFERGRTSPVVKEHCTVQVQDDCAVSFQGRADGRKSYAVECVSSPRGGE